MNSIPSEFNSLKWTSRDRLNSINSQQYAYQNQPKITFQSISINIIYKRGIYEVAGNFISDDAKNRQNRDNDCHLQWLWNGKN